MATGSLAGATVVLPFQTARRGRPLQPCSQHNCISNDFLRGSLDLSKAHAFAAQNLGISRIGTGRLQTRRVTTMASKVTGMIKLALPAGKANPAPPVGPALGARGVNIMQFCKEYNAATQEKMGTIIPVEITVYEDRSFTFVLKTPPASVLIKQALGVESGSGKPNSQKIGNLSRDKLREIAGVKLPDLNTDDLEAATRIVEGTARNMGVVVVD